MYSVTMAGKFVGWEQRGKSTAKYQEDLKTKLTVMKSVNGKFPLGTAYLAEVLRKKKMSYDNYENFSKEDRKPFETQADDLLLACLFIKNCKQWGNDNIELALENLYSRLEGKQDIYPQTLGDAAEQYEMNYCKARKNGKNNRNSKTKEEEKEGDEGGQVLGSHFEVADQNEDENQNKDETEEEE